MRRLTNRVERVEQATTPRPVFVHVDPGQTEAGAVAAHERAHGPIPEGAHVIVIQHTFTSAL
jgi:hypothetical protein